MSDMKNIIFILADGMCDYFLDKKIGGIDVCPNIKRLADTGYRFTNVYSQAPFTMAALTPVLSQSDSLSEHNYEAVLGGKDRLIYDDLTDNGYDIFGAFYCDLLFPSRVLRKFKYRWPILLERFVSMEIPYIRYYIDYLRGHSETDNSRDKDALGFLIKCFFDSSKLYYCDLKWTGITELFSKSLDFPWEDFIKEMESESEQYYSNPELYVEELIECFDSKRLFSREFIFNTAVFLDDESLTRIKRFYSEYKKEFNGLLFKQLYINLMNYKKDCIKIFGNLIRDVVQGNLQTGTAKKELIQFLMRIRDFSLSYKSFVSTNMIATTGDPSAYSQLNRLKNAIIDNKNHHKPYFACAHLMDTHQPFNFFTAEDSSLCNVEMNDHIDLINHLNHNEWRGNLSYLLAAHYIDGCIGSFLDHLNIGGALNDTIVVFCADHGLQYGDSPIRNKTQGENYNWESYHVPCIIKDYSKNECKVINTCYSAKNIFPTVFKMANIRNIIPEKCVDMLAENVSDMYANIEYLGPGQPDIYRKFITYGLRDEKYYLVCKVPLESDVSKEHIEAIYDLLHDPCELTNKKSDLCNECDIIKMLNIIRARHMEVRDEYLNRK